MKRYGACLFLLLASGCATHGTLRVRTLDDTGGAVPGALVTVESISTPSGRDGVATFHLNAKRYQVDAQVPGMLSCGPVPVTVHGGQVAVVSVVMRVGTIGDGVVIGATPRESHPYSDVSYGPCPDKPGSERVITTYPPAKQP